MAKRHGVYYSFRKLTGLYATGYGILISTWRNAQWVETDQNLTPWLNATIALKRSQGYARALGELRGLPVFLSHDPGHHKIFKE